MSGRAYQKFLRKQRDGVLLNKEEKEQEPSIQVKEDEYNEEEEEEEEEEMVPINKRQNLFALLNDEADEEDNNEELEDNDNEELEDNDNEELEDNYNAELGDNYNDIHDNDAERETEFSLPPPSNATKQQKSKRKKKLAKKSSKNASIEQLDSIDSDLEELSKALCEISSPQLSEVESKNPSSPYLSAVGSNISASRHYPSAIFAVSDAKLFDQENEMKKLFGSRIIQAEAGTASGSGARRNRRRPINRKATLANPNDHWPPFANCGLSMEFMGKSNGNNPTTDKILVLFNVELEISNFQVTHSSNYVQVQKNFLDFMALHDPSLIGQLLQSNPYHVDSLLVMSEVLKQSGDITSAAILIERALYAFERTFHSMFNATLGTCHLSYFRAENRSFYIALFRHIQYVSRKGCWRTAFELNRFLLSLDPSNDPMGVLLMIDFFGLQSGQFKALHGIYKTLKWRKRLDLLPNWSYSLALIYNEEGKREKCVAQLEKAIIQFPNVVKLLIEKSSHFIAAKLKDHLYLTESDNKGLDLLQKIYVARSSSLWKPAGLQGLISEALTNALAKVDSNDSFVDTAKNFRQTEYASLPQNIYRHAMLADLGNEVNVSVPPEMISGRGGIHMHDPLPPISGAEPSVYDNYLEDREAAITENRRLQGNPLYLLLESLIPNWTPERALQIQQQEGSENALNRLLNILRDGMGGGADNGNGDPNGEFEDFD